MNNNPLVSVIVPVYNTSILIKRCIDSILNQTYENIEIIIIDDGSTDLETIEICNRYATDYPDIITVFHKDNEGQGVARNIGLDLCKGEYVSFIDSDDYIDYRMYEILVDNLNKYDADISCCNNGIDTLSDTETIKIFSNQEVMYEHLLNNSGTGQSPCDKMYKKSLFDTVRFEKLRAYEDCATLFRVISKANTVVHIDKTLYFYITRENSTMTQKFSAVKFQSIQAYYYMYNFYKENYPQYLSDVVERLIGSFLFCMGESLNKKKIYTEEIEQAFNLIRQIDKSLFSNKHAFLLKIIRYCPFLYSIIYRTMKK